MFSGFGQTYFISLSNDAIRAAHGLSHSQFGLIYGGATLASAFTLSNFGKLVDRFSVRRSAILTVLGLSLACALMAISSLTVVILPLAIFALRLFGQGFCGHVAMTSAGKWYTKNRGKAVSIVGLGFPLSESFMPAVAAVILSTAGLAYLWGG
ncbi:MAG TPA: MFS transporter, partial [Hyphomonadaceae bacterium]|nr:MFS transporter [Hyphomonadaceae bacterium]